MAMCDLACRTCGGRISKSSASGLCRRCFLSQIKLLKRYCVLCERQVGRKNKTGFCDKCVRESRQEPNVPTPEEIEQRCREIRKSWPKSTWRSQPGYPREYELPCVKVPRELK